MSSFCSEIPVNCATTIDLKPVDFAPSAFNPHIPNSERKDKLNMYGEAPATVSDDSFIDSPPATVITRSFGVDANW